jgi:hypothetical protein
VQDMLPVLDEYVPLAQPMQELDDEIACTEE